MVNISCFLLRNRGFLIKSQSIPLKKFEAYGSIKRILKIKLKRPAEFVKADEFNEELRDGKEVETSAESAEDFEDVKTNNMIMYLSSEYKVLNPMFTTEITVTTEFEAKEVEIYSEKESEKYDTYLMSQESRYVWKFKAVFDEVGEYIITAKAVSESGQEIEESMIIIVRWH